MKKTVWVVWLSAVLALGASPLARADVVVLVHGYLSAGQTWRDSGISAALLSRGWGDAGPLWPGLPNQAAVATTGKLFYTAELASEAPLLWQADQLAQGLRSVRQRHPGHALTLVGHSSGGVVARAAMVRHSDLQVSTLVTIASPHLGTDKAELGLAVADSPLGWFAPVPGLSTLNRSQNLYAELVREVPGSFLFWLNRQPHPQAEYVSIVRAGENFGGALVPAYSQHLERVAALQQRARSLISPSDHALHPADGAALLQILESRSAQATKL